jgi:hypothetical protein
MFTERDALVARFGASFAPRLRPSTNWASSHGQVEAPDSPSLSPRTSCTPTGLDYVQREFRANAFAPEPSLRNVCRNADTGIEGLAESARGKKAKL